MIMLANSDLKGLNKNLQQNNCVVTQGILLAAGSVTADSHVDCLLLVGVCFCVCECVYISKYRKRR